MNDRPEPDRDPAAPDPTGPEELDFDDPGHAWVRDLLADARVTTPVPDEVAARLDDTLARLQAERAGSGVGAGVDQERSAAVVPLRRRIAPRLAAAAAAVILVAAGGVAVTRLGTGGSGSSESAGSSADTSAGKALSPSGPGLPSGQGPQDLAAAALPSLTTTSFAADAAAVMRRVAAAGSPDAVGSPGSGTASAPVPAQTPGESQPDSSAGNGPGASTPLQAPPVTAVPPGLQPELRSPAAAACTGPAIAGAVTLPATLDGTRVALLFRRPTAAGQRVEAWSCDGSTLLVGATVAP